MRRFLSIVIKIGLEISLQKLHTGYFQNLCVLEKNNQTKPPNTHTFIRIPEEIALKKKKKEKSQVTPFFSAPPHMLQNCLIWMKSGGWFMWIFKDSCSNCT